MIKDQRYIRQTALKEFGSASQQKLQNARVLIVGAGGLGIPVMEYLNAMGTGTIGIVDHDMVSLSNLHRQVIYTEDELYSPKVEAAGRYLKKQNSFTKIDLYYTMLDRDNAMGIIKHYDLVVDATDNFCARYLINDACVILGKPFVYAALHGFEGHLSVFNYQNGPTYRCLFPDFPVAAEIPNCNENGVLGVLPGIIGTMQALEAVKVICGIGEVLSGKLMIYNGLRQQFYFMKFDRKATSSIKNLADDYEAVCSVNSIDYESFMRRYVIEKLQIIDVRTAQEFDAFSLEASINIPLNSLDTSSDMINAGEKVYVLCQSGLRSQKAVSFILSRFPGIDAVYIKGGLNSIYA